MADGGEGQLFDDSNQAAEARAHHLQDLQSYFGMLQAHGSKILARDEHEFGGIQGRGGSRVVATVKDGQFGDGAAGAFDGQNVLAAVGRGLKDSDAAGGDYVEARASIALGKEQLTRRIGFQAGPRRQERQLVVSQRCKECD